MTKDEAVKALNDVGLGYKQVVQSSKTVAKDTVISQGTKVGAKVAKNTQIILTISGGEEVVNTTVPSVTGESESDARENWNQQDLRFRLIMITAALLMKAK